MLDRTRTIPVALPVYDSRTQHITIASTTLGIRKSFYVYVPPDLAPEQRAPTLYLLRGHEREWINKDEDKTRGDTNIVDVVERLRAAGTIGPLILVFPGLSSDDNRVPGLLLNMRDPERVAAHSGIGSGRFADYFFDELIPYVDAQLPTLNNGRHRAIAGFSLGGAMAIKAAAQHPELFAGAVAYDGTFLYATEHGRNVRQSDKVIHNPIFDAAYGVPRDYDLVAQHSPANLILRGDAAALARITWMIGYGPRSQEPWQANYYRGEHLVRCLRARGIANALPVAALPDGDHTWRTTDRWMEQLLPMLYAKLTET